MRKLLPLFALGCLAATTAAQAQQISPYLAGQNAWMAYSYGARVYNGQLDQLWPLVRKSKVRMVRIGGNGVEFNMPTPQQYLGMIDSIRRIGAEPMVQLPEGRGRYTAQQAAAVVDYVNNQMHRGVKYWIIGNEPNLTGNFGKVTVAGVEAYIKSWATAMKQADPTILTVGPETSFYDTSYLRPLLGGANDVTGKDAYGRYYLDVITFHSYPFSGTQTRAQVLAAANTLAGNVNGLLTMIDAANTLHGRTGAEALQWAVTEFNIGYQNPTANGVDGLGVHGFLNGQYWAEVFGIGMQKGALSMQPWSIHEGNGARGEGDLGYLDGSGPGIKPRSAFYHEMLVAENLHGRYLAATDNQSEVSVVSSRHGDTTAVMVLNKSNTTDFDFTVQLSGAAVPGAAPLKINVPAGISASYTDKIYGQSTQVLLFDGQGQLLRKIVYSLQHAASNLAPTYLRPGQAVTLADFRADKTFTCVAPEQVSFAPTILGTYSSLSWNFGAGATPQTATGPGPFSVSYAAPGLKSVTMTLQNPDTTIVVSKADYVQASACLRTPYAGTAAAVPGVIRAVEFDNGGQNVAYYDSDPTNRGAALNPNVPRPTEAVDTELGDGGLGNIGYSASGEWLKYTVNVQRTGLYKLTVRTAASAAGGSFRVSVDGVDKTGVVPVPATGAFGTYQDIVVNNVYLQAGANATLQFDLVSSSFNFSKLTFEEQPAPAGIVVNRLYNATSTPDGLSDAVELLVVKDHQDLRGLIVKDFESNLTSDAGGKYQFRDAALWKDVRIGTTIVLRRLAAGITGYAEDLDAADYRVDLLLENGSYLSNLAPNNSFNLTNTDMVLLKTGTAAGTAGAVHAFATGNSNTALFQAVTSPKLVSAAVTNTGQFQYPLSPTQTVADYNGTAAAASFDANRNWGNGFGAGNVAYIQSLRNAAFTPPGIVVNRVYNGSNDANGQTDAVELLVTQDHFDARNLVVKDFETNNTADNGGKYRFNNIGFWQDLRRGTTIVLRRVSGPAGYQPDLDASDFTLDLLLDNAGYLTNLATGNAFNITQYDMVLLKTGTAAGVAGAIHAFATKGGGSNGVPSALFNSVTAPKLTSPDGTDAGGGTFHYPLNPEQRLQDYAGAQGALSKSTSFTWGYGFGANNAAYIQSLRDSVLAPPAALTATPTANRVRLHWTASPAAEASGYELYRSATGTSYALLTTLAPDATSFVDSCRSFGARYYYQLRTLGPDLTSRFTPAASALTEARPALNLPALRGECSVAATAPTTVDLCGGTVTATTTDPTSYAAQGSYAINWLFAFADGSTTTARQSVLVQDQTAPTVRTQNLTVQLDASGQASITAADVNDGSTDACGIGALALSRTTFGCAQVGPNPVTLTVTDVNGNAASAEAVVTVQDRVAPIVRTRNLTVTLSGGTARATVTDVDNGSADACGLELLMLDRTTFDCGNLGPNTVTLTATDVHGNVASAPATVTVVGAVPAPVIALSRTDNTYTGLPAGTLALGYGAQQLTLTASNPTSAAGATRYQWSPAAGLSSASSASPTFAPTAAGTYSFTVTATNEFGCVGTAAVSVEVIDARCGTKNDKVLLCHNGNLLCVAPSAVAAHLTQHHDQLGGCATAARGAAAGPSAATQADAASQFEAFPNPFAERATLRFRPASAGPAQLQVYNALGQLVTTLFDAPAEAGRRYEVTLDGAPLKAGVYTCRLLSGGRVETRRVVLVK